MSVTIVAELSGNHERDKDRALRLIEEAKWAGADAVKLQTFSPEFLAVDNPVYTTLSEGAWRGRTLLDLYRETALPWEWHRELFKHAESLGMECFSSPFHPEAVSFLESLGCPRYKVASFEIGDIPLLQAIAATRKPAIISTGLATPEEIRCAVGILGPRTTLLHCISEYPATEDEMNMGRMHALRLYGPVGLSDHSLTPTASVCAVALGATVIEKHIQHEDGEGPDAGFSLTPDQFWTHVQHIRSAEKAMAPTGSGLEECRYAPLKKSLWVVENVRAGDEITPANIRVLRPGNGIPPSGYRGVLGLRFAADVQAGEPLTQAMLDTSEAQLDGRSVWPKAPEYPCLHDARSARGSESDAAGDGDALGAQDRDQRDPR